ncbi:MAG: efflux RND transporter periplasmic adaptor subunit [Cyanobacteria bacterium P01_H01_bin.58]
MAVFRDRRSDFILLVSKRWLTAVVLTTSALGLTGCVFWQAGGEGPSGAAYAEASVAVDAAIARMGTPADGLTYTGTTQPQQRVALRSRVDGQVTLLTVDVGDRVANGDAVARLDTDLLTIDVNEAAAELLARQSEVAQAEAAVSDARTALELARVQLQQAQLDADRLARLAAEGAISAQDAELAQVAADTAQQVLRSAEEQIRTRQEAVNAAAGRVSAQQAAVAEARERLSFAIVQSPLTGTVMTRSVEVGDYVETGDELLQVGDLSQLKVMIEVSDRDLAQISQGQPVTVTLDALPEVPLVGKVTQIAPAADATSRLVPVEILINNTTRRMGSGLLARVAMQAVDGDRMLIPAAALLIAETTEPSTVFVVQSPTAEEPTVKARRVTVGQQIDTQVEILAGLQPGETYVVNSSAPLSDGQAVRLSILSETQEATPE